MYTARHERQLLDGAVAGRETVLHLPVRRFFCTPAGCVRRVFAEQVDGLTQYAMVGTWRALGSVAGPQAEGVLLAVDGDADDDTDGGW